MFKESDRLCKVELFYMLYRRYLVILKKTNSENVSTPKVGVLNVSNSDFQIFKKFNMSQMNPKEVFHNTAYSSFKYLT